MLSDTVTEEHVADVISRATGIPLGSLLQGESERLLHMEEVLKQSVVGQVGAWLLVGDGGMTGVGVRGPALLIEVVFNTTTIKPDITMVGPSRQGHRQLRPPLPRGPARARPPPRRIPLPGAYRRGQDAPDQEGHRVHVQRRAGPGAYVRV